MTHSVAPTESRSPCGLDEVYAGILTYYTEKVLEHGATPRGVDWSDARTQQLRFAQLLRICDFSAPFTLNDIGCGYGALLSHLDQHQLGAKVDYHGVDLSPAMIRQATRLWGNRPHTRFTAGNVGPRRAEYSIASGIFNVQLDQPHELWSRFVAATLADMRKSSNKGFAVNFKRAAKPGSSAEWGLYRTAPEPWISFCEEKLAASVECLAAYGLQEFTLLVRL